MYLQEILLSITTTWENVSVGKLSGNSEDIKFMTHWGRVFAAVIKEGPAFLIIFLAPQACALKRRVGAKSNPEIRVWQEGRSKVSGQIREAADKGAEHGWKE